MKLTFTIDRTARKVVFDYEYSQNFLDVYNNHSIQKVSSNPNRYKIIPYKYIKNTDNFRINIGNNFSSTDINSNRITLLSRTRSNLYFYYTKDINPLIIIKEIKDMMYALNSELEFNKDKVLKLNE